MNDKVNGNAPRLDVTPAQLAALLVIDASVSALETGTNQLANVGLKRESDILRERLKDLLREKEKLLLDWSRRVQLVSALPSPSIIPGKG